MRRIDLSKRAVRSLNRLPPKHKRQVSVKITELLADPTPPDGKPLKGSPYWRATSGEYRIIYSFDTTTVFIYDVGKRNDSQVYRNLPKRL